MADAQIVSPNTDASITFVVPDGSTPKRFRYANAEGFSDWTETTEAVVSVPATNNTLSISPVEPRVVQLDVGTDILTTTYLVISDEPLVEMENSFQSISDASALAAMRFDLQNWSNASYANKISAMISAYEILCGYRYFIYHERDEWGSRQTAGYGLPFADDYDSVNTLEDYTRSDFEDLRNDFKKRIKSAQVVVADVILGSLSSDPDDGLAGDPNLLSEKIGDTSRTWRAARTVQPMIGQRAMRIMANYISSTPRLVRN